MNEAAEPPVQIRVLSRLIAYHPGVPLHYVLRGEEWLALGDCDRARADFEQARALSAALLVKSDWGYIHQAYLDRAEAGLRGCGA